MAPIPGFIGSSYRAQSPTVDAERTVNWYLEKRDAGTPAEQAWLYATPGLSPFLSAGSGPHRAGFAQDGRAWVISGTDWREIFADGTSISRGTVAAGTDQGTIVSNGVGGSQLLGVVGGYGYVYNLTLNTVTQIADVDFPNGTAIMCAFLDGYGIVLTSTDFQISALEDFTDWDALDIAQKSQTSDQLVSIAVDIDHKVIWLLGSQTTEIWWDSGAAAFPFEPVPNSIISQGCGASAGVLSPKAAMIWIGQNADGGRMAFAGVGAGTNRISTHGVEAAWADYPTVADGIAWNYDWRGHMFCVFTFPSGTWVYDVLEQEWHEWLEWDQASGSYVQHLARTHLYAFDKHLVGSRLDGTLYELRADVFADGGQLVRRLRRSPHVDAKGRRLTCTRLEFQCQTGVGLSSGQGSDPQIMLRLSRDGGRTWGAERWASLGAMGAYLTRVCFWRNGQWRDGVIELTVTDPVVTVLIGCDGTFEAAA